MKYRATIKKRDGSEEVRDFEAPTRFAVYDMAQKDGNTVVELEESALGIRIPAWLNITIGTGIKRVEVIRVAKNLSAMLAAGLSISRALSIIERQSSNKNLRKVATGLSESIKKGSSFHEALALYPNVFSELFVAMARAGEESGSLSASLLVVGTQMERSEELSRKIKGAMIYPAIVVTAIVIVTILMLIYVVPTLTKTFTELGVQVPFATRVIVAISNFMVANILLMMSVIIVVIAGGYFFVKSKFGSFLVLNTVLRLPVVGEIARETYTARAARTMSSLLSSGVPVLNALNITKDVVHAEVFADVITEAGIRVKKGEPLSSAFAEKTSLYPIQMSDMLAVGEETGKVAEMLKQIAEFYETDVSDRTKDLSTIIEPVLMLFIGVVVGVFAVSMIAPIYSLSSAI